jgi:TfoX/Sxy family transcriptional regulator of competence genes
MAFNIQLSERIRQYLTGYPMVEEKVMFGGICFMVDNKMCVGVVKEEMMCRLPPEMMEEVLEKVGCRSMDFTGKSMKGYVFVDETGYRAAKDFDFWMKQCLAFNPLAKASKKKKQVSI